jgi:hypothetical protein
MPTLKGLASMKTPGKSSFPSLSSALGNIKLPGKSNKREQEDRDSPDNSASFSKSDDDDDSTNPTRLMSTGSGAVSLEATMSLKFSKATGNKTKWFEAYVVLDMSNHGSVKCYPKKPKTKASELEPAKASRRQSTRIGATQLSFVEEIEPLLEIPPHLNWLAKDFEHSSTRFVIEIPTEGAIVRQSFLSENTGVTDLSTLDSSSSSSDNLEVLDDPGGSLEDEREKDQEQAEEETIRDTPDSLMEAIESARKKREPFRLHVQCIRRGGNEKHVWMTAFEELGRLSFDLHKRVFGLTRKLKDPKLKLKHERIRAVREDRFTKQAQILSSQGEIAYDSANDDEEEESNREIGISGSPKSDFRLTRKSDNREFLVYPSYAYPNKWMTHSEMFAEMMHPSQVFHDMRLSSDTRKEIGTVRIEVLECSGIPILDWNSETDAVVYLVCGSYAFTTDVIMKKLNPVWLPRARRACILPIYHAYAKLYVGVFDDDGPGQKDDFAGRAVLDLARCRPGSTYDIALPLRLSKHTYSRRPRGAIRLRFSIDYPSERAALLSYLPARRKGKTSTNKDDHVTVLCHDEKSFRNTALTVHGNDIPGRFTTPLMKATVREINFLRKVGTNAIENQIYDIIFWKNRSVSCLCFSAWMHCVYLNSFALVPFYIISFQLLLMLQNYVFYGSDGRIQQGFIPPSFEEMLAALFKLPGQKSRAIEPLYVKTHKDERSALVADKTYKTHQQRGKKLFELLGFTSETEHDQPEDYHMEFPLSRGLLHPITDEYQYPRLTIEECRVKKKSPQKDKDDNLGTDSEFVAAMSSEKTDDDSVNPLQFPGRLGFTKENLQAMIGDKAVKSPISGVKSKLKMSLKKCHQKSDFDRELVEAFRNLPSSLRIPDQDIDAKEISDGKKISEELDEFRDNIHNLTFNLFHDKTYIMEQNDAVYFGGKQSKNVATDLNRLLGAGQYASANPVMSKIGVHLEPLIDAAHSMLGTLRSIINVYTWQDPICSFWVTIALFVAAFVSIIFPFRLFFFATGFAVLGPQNSLIAYIRPNFLEELKEKKEEKREARLSASKEKKFIGIPRNQPIFTAHTSDNSPPLNLSVEDVDRRGIHQVCVPYSQLTYRRDSYWPPEPEYGKCDPNTHGFEKSAERLRELNSRQGSIGIPAQRSSSKLSK